MFITSAGWCIISRSEISTSNPKSEPINVKNRIIEMIIEELGAGRYNLSRPKIPKYNPAKAYRFYILKNDGGKKKRVAVVKAYRYPDKEKYLNKIFDSDSIQDGNGLYEYTLLSLITIHSKEKITPTIYGYVPEWDAVIMENVFSTSEGDAEEESLISRISKICTDFLGLPEKKSCFKTYEDVFIDIKKRFLKGEDLTEKQSIKRHEGLKRQAELDCIGDEIIRGHPNVLRQPVTPEVYGLKLMENIKRYLVKCNQADARRRIKDEEKQISMGGKLSLQRLISEIGSEYLKNFSVGGETIDLSSIIENLTKAFSEFIFSNEKIESRRYFNQIDAGPQNMTTHKNPIIFDFDEARQEYLVTDAIPWLKTPLQNIPEDTVIDDLIKYIDWRVANTKGAGKGRNYYQDIVNFYLLNIVSDIRMIGIISRDDFLRSTIRREYVEKDKGIYSYKNLMRWYKTDLLHTMTRIQQKDIQKYLFEKERGSQHIFNELFGIINILKLNMPEYEGLEK